LLLGPRCNRRAGHTQRKWMDWWTDYAQVLILGRDCSRWGSNGTDEACLSGSRKAACPA
jgi:hypothetical protein